MFPRRERLPRADFPLVLKTGRRVDSPHFTVVFSDNMKGCAVVVSKKTARLSVTRHSIKRRVLAALSTLSLPRGGLIVFPKSSAHSVSYEDIRGEIAQSLLKINRRSNA